MKSSKNKKNDIKIFYNFLWDKVYIFNRFNGFYFVIICIIFCNIKIIINLFFINKKNLKIYEYIYFEFYFEIKDCYFFLIF